MTKRMAIAAVVVAIGVGLVAGSADAFLIIGPITKTAVTSADSFQVDQAFVAGNTVDDWMVTAATSSPGSGVTGGGGILALTNTKTYGGWQGPNGALSTRPVGVSQPPYGGAVSTAGPTLHWGANSSTNYGQGDCFGGGGRVQFSLTPDNVVRTVTFVVAADYADEGTLYMHIFYGGSGTGADPGIWMTSDAWTKGPYEKIQFTYAENDVVFGDMYVQIAGSDPLYSYHGGETLGLNFVTVESASSEIPEPATMLLVGTGALGVFGLVRRQRVE